TALLVQRSAPAEPSPRASAQGSLASRGLPSFRLTASRGASWRTLQRGATLKLGASHGHFELAVEALRAGQRFLVELPDGELEVIGTRFTLDVEPARTLAVRVSEGHVALRLRARAALTLSAGEAWSAEPQATVIAAGAPRETRATDDEPRQHEQPAARERSTLRSRGPASEPASALGDAGRSFAAAMAAFSAGDYAHANRLFAEFEHAHPADARVEDAAFLRAVAHARRGDSDASRAAAREYLRRYPNGLRRAEAERLAATDSATP
ncbi:MAG TPA: hypothetical protein VK509_17870, partial [Polyangiales bacterium]|nr:hypothetical protein [Polyangiales bacterium]